MIYAGRLSKNSNQSKPGNVRARSWPFAILGIGFAKNVGQIVSMRVKARDSSNLVASRRFKMENDSRPV